jgi:anionic cell wall polymer biosynthesis LytR-Cps2A-Psr (LCP) family protein
LIDSLGGIDVNVPEQVVVESQVFEPGLQHMDGARALMYSRLRPDGDFKRIERQQLVMMATAKKALGTGMLNDPLGAFGQYRSIVDTDLPTARVPGIGLLAEDIGLENVATYSLACYRASETAECSPAVTPFTTEDGAQVLLPVWDLVRQIIHQALPAVELPEGEGAG